jgi:hypothetical protein
MSILDKLATSLHLRDEVPNQELVCELAATHNIDGIREVAEALSNKDAAIRVNCVKVLYAIGYLTPLRVVPKKLKTVLHHPVKQGGI